MMSSDRGENLEDFHDYPEHEEQECPRSAPQNAEKSLFLRENRENLHQHVCAELECQRSAPQYAVRSPVQRKNLEDLQLYVCDELEYLRSAWGRNLKTSMSNLLISKLRPLVGGQP